MSCCGHYRGYDDDWIIKSMPLYTSWRSLFNAYYKKFAFGTYTNFRNHLYNDLGFTRSFTTEQDEWLKENYPKLGSELATKMIVKKFGVGRSVATITNRAYKLGISVDTDVVNKIKKERNQRHSLPIGSTVVRTNSYGKSCVWEKTKDGWKRQSHLVCGDIPEGYVVVHYDGDFQNNNPDNVVAISKTTLAQMTYNHFWSEFPEITKTAILCCELEQLTFEK